MAKAGTGRSAIHEKILALMKSHPSGVSAADMRRELGIPADRQVHFDRRIREMPTWFVIHKKWASIASDGRQQRVLLYQYAGERAVVTDEGQISQRQRAAVIHAAHQRCQMCGRTVETHGITLVVDHKKPRDWGGTNDRENLWAICEECNAGKKAYFSSLDLDLMKTVTAHRSVHVRIGELLKAVGAGKGTPSALIDVVADQDDWQKRLRELRYPVIGWKIGTRLYKANSGRKLSEYVLLSSKPWPKDPTGEIRRFEIERQKRNAAARESKARAGS